MTQAIVTIGYDRYLLPIDDATKLVSLLAKAVQVSQDYDSQYEQRGLKSGGYTYVRAADNQEQITLAVHKGEIEPSRREKLPELEDAN